MRRLRRHSVTAGTIHSSKLPLTVCLGRLSDGHPLQQFGAACRGSALGSYKSAWLCAPAAAGHGRACPRAPAGIAEIDETESPARQGRSDQGGGVARPRAKCSSPARRSRHGAPAAFASQQSRTSAASLHGFVAANLAQGATIKTDGWAAYPGAPNVAHDPHVVGNMAAHIVLPWIPRLLQLEDFGARRLPRPAKETSPKLSRQSSPINPVHS